jgi:Tfp pilus assembly protein PilF
VGVASVANQKNDSVDALGIALAQSHGSDEARALLEKHSRLIDAQEVLARADLRHRGWQIIGERVGALIKGLTALVGILILVGIASFLWSASRASGMVVDAFSVPPPMDRQGLTGAVVAGQLLDEVIAIEASTESARAPSSYENSWSDTDGVVVPYTGVSLGQLRRDARAWLGSETHLKGEVVQLGGGRIGIAFRAGKASGRVEGKEAEFDAVLKRAAATVFKTTQPYRYVVWLGRNGGNPAEADQVLTTLARSSDLRERLWAMHALALNASTNAEAKAIYQRALRLRPDFLPAIGNMPIYALAAGQEEEAYKLRQRATAAYQAGQPDYNPLHAASYALESEASAAEMKGDLQSAARMRAEAVDQVAAANVVATRPFNAAEAHAAVHDFAAAQATLAAAGYLDPARRADVEAKYGPQLRLKQLLAIAADDSGVRAAELQTTIAALRQSASRATAFASQAAAEESINLLRPTLAIALARAGHWGDAEAVIAPMPANHDAAIRARGLIAAYAGRGTQSDALFARAVARTPSLPAGHYAWAEALLLRGDTRRAIEQARLANHNGPRWAEPLKLWGDALVAKRNYKEASAKYAAAAERAPRWGRLHMRWASTLWRLGKRDEARARLRAASAMDLSEADRRHLATMWARATA